MMVKLLKKEFTLSAHPMVFIMLALSMMVMIPNYPYTVIFFYTSLGIFFTCLQGRENHDILYMVSLPIAKKDVVKARIFFSAIVEMMQLALIVPFMIFRRNVMQTQNEAGLEANLALIAAGLLLYSIFNYVFFTRYYKKLDKVGSSFLISSAVMFVGVLIIEAGVHINPFMKERLDTVDPKFMTEKLLVFAASILIYGIVLVLTYKKSAKTFIKQDI